MIFSVSAGVVSNTSLLYSTTLLSGLVSLPYILNTIFLSSVVYPSMYIGYSVLLTNLKSLPADSEIAASALAGT